MKKNEFMATMLAMLVICGLCVTSCGNDDEEEGGGGGNNGGKKETTSYLDDYVYKYWTRCERVGANLVVEFAFENLTDKNISGAQLTLANDLIYDNLGNQYRVGFSTSLASATNISSISNYSNRWQTLNIPAKSTVFYFIKIEDFDSSNKASSISFGATFSATSGLPATSYTLETSTIPITDNRIMNNGIMTNDTALVYTVTNCERVGSVLQVDFTITNNSDIEMGGLSFSPADIAQDNMGNNYYVGNIQVAFGEALYKNSYLLRLKPRETANGRIRIKDFDSTNRASLISFSFYCSAANYVLSDNVVRFRSIPIKDNRVTSDGIQTPDFKLDVKLTGAEIDNEGYLKVNYTIQNNTGENLNNFTIQSYSQALDDLSNTYYIGDFYYSINNSNFFSQGVRMTIHDGATVPATVAIKDFSTKAKNVTFNLKVSCDNYEFADDIMHFITIPISK